MKIWYLMIFLLVLGVIYRLILTWNGNFIFNMDNARDILDVREMVLLQKPRLIGPTSGLEGIYNGPFWYFLLALPFIVSGGHPYSEVILMIIFWFVGGVFLVKLMSRYGVLATLVSVMLWISSNYLVLSSLFAYNPNPVLFLTPALIFSIEKFLQQQSLRWGLLVGFLGGLFFNFEMAFGMFVPVIILLAALIVKKKLFLNRNLYFAAGSFIFTLVPQLLFYLKNGQLLSNFFENFFSGKNNFAFVTDLSWRFEKLRDLYLFVLSGTMMNQNILKIFALLAMAVMVFKTVKNKLFKKDYILLLALLFILVPFTGALFLPFDVMPWHLGAQIAAVILIIGIFVKNLRDLTQYGKILALIVTLILVAYAVNNLELKKNLLRTEENSDPVVFLNQIRAIDFIYQKAEGKNFKVYTYMPSVYDYPYQYLFWWRGKERYGYLPEEYAYLPNKPAYIRNKEKFTLANNSSSSEFIFLIKQPDQRGDRHLWENNFSNLPLISTDKIGPIKIETRKGPV